MKAKPWTRFLCLLLVGLFALIPCSIQAEDVSGEQETLPEGLIRIELKETDDHRSRENVEFELYRVADLVDGEFEYFDAWQTCTLGVEELDQFDPMKAALSLFKKLAVHQPADQVRKSDEQGIVEFKGLPRGLYYLRVSDPASYERIEDLLVALPLYNEQEGRMENKVSVYAKAWPLPIVEIIKTDTNHQVLAGQNFEFSSFQDAQATDRIESKTGEPDGHVQFSLNLNQTIYIKETKAPEGYDLSPKIIEAALDEEGLLTINGKPVELKQNRAVIEVQNRQATKAKTGMDAHTATWFGLFLGSLSLLALLWIQRRKPL